MAKTSLSWMRYLALQSITIHRGSLALEDIDIPTRSWGGEILEISQRWVGQSDQGAHGLSDLIGHDHPNANFLIGVLSDQICSVVSLARVQTRIVGIQEIPLIEW
jgi:hypothetical protein